MDAAYGSDWRSDQVSLNTNGCTQSKTPAHLDQQTSSQKQTFGCAHCISTFKTRGNLRLHLNGVHLVEPLKKLQYSKCDFCDSYYKLKKRLEKHMALNHKENFVILNPHKCGCGESFPSMFACIKHQRISNCAPKKKSTHKIDAKYGNLPPNLTTSKSTKKKLNTIPKCVQCDKTFTSTFNLKRHMETHKHPPHECSICSKSFHQKTTLQTHLKTVHLGIRSFQCSHCLARFTQKVYLKNHIKSIHPTDPVIQAQAHKCQFCDSYYSCKIHLSKHMTNLHMNVAEGDLNSITQQDIVKNNNHLDSKLESRLEDIQLESCESKKTPNDDFSAPSSVRVPDIQTVEIVMIDGKRCFKCDKCDHLSSKYSNIERHMTCHSDIKPFKCSLCDLRFKFRSGLREHLKTVHDIKCKINDNRVLWKEIKNLTSDIFTMTNKKKKNRAYIENTIKTEDDNIRSKQNKVLDEDQCAFKTDENIFGLSMPLLEDDSVSNKKILVAEKPKEIQISDKISVLSVHDPSTKSVDSPDLNDSNLINSFSSPVSSVNVKQYADNTTAFSQDAVLGQASSFVVDRVKLSFTGFKMPKRDFNNECSEVAFSLEHLNEHPICHIDDITASSEHNEIALFSILSDGIDSESYDNPTNIFMETSTDLLSISDRLQNRDMVKITDTKISSLECPKFEDKHSSIADSGELCKETIESTQTETISRHPTNQGKSTDVDCSVSSLDVSFDINAESFQSSGDNISLSDIFMDVQHCNPEIVKFQKSVNIRSRTGKSQLPDSNHKKADLLDQNNKKNNKKNGMDSPSISDHHNQPHCFNNKTEKTTKENMTSSNCLPLDVTIVNTSLSDRGINGLKTKDSKLASYVNSQGNLYDLAVANTALPITIGNENDPVKSINFNNADMFLEDTPMDGIMTFETSVNAQFNNLDFPSICTNEKMTEVYSIKPIDINNSLSDINIYSTENSDQVTHSLESLENPGSDIFDLLLCLNDDANTTTGQTITLPNTSYLAHSVDTVAAQSIKYTNNLNYSFPLEPFVDPKLCCGESRININPAKINGQTPGNIDFQLNETQDANISLNEYENSQVCSNYESFNEKDIVGNVRSTNADGFLKDLYIPEMGEEVDTESTTKSYLPQSANTNEKAINSMNGVNTQYLETSLSNYSIRTTMGDGLTNCVTEYQSMDCTTSDRIEKKSMETLKLWDVAQNVKEIGKVHLHEAIEYNLMDTEDNSVMNNDQLQLSLNPNLIHEPDYIDDGNNSGNLIIGCEIGTTVKEWDHSNVHKKIVFKGPEEMLQTILEQIPTKIDHPHKCKICLASFKKPSDLRNHEKIHSSRDKLLCDLCGSEFSSKSAIALHMKYHDPVSMVCWICGKLLREISFKSHVCFAACKKLSCPFCNDKFKSRSARLKHLSLMHMKCKECNMEFTLVSKLRHHRTAVHNEKGQFVCECGKAHWKQSELLRHQRIHSKSKGFRTIKK